MSGLSIVLLGPGKGFSGRAVKIRQVISVTDKDDALLSAATSAGENMQKFVFLRMREGAMRMVQAVTKPEIKSYDEVRALDAAEWQPIGLGDLDNESSARHHSKLFTPKDWDILIDLYRRANEASGAEVEAILSGMLQVSEG